MIKGVIFDMDGVLVDNKNVHIEAFVIFCRRHGIDIDTERLMPLFGMGNDDIIAALFGRRLPAEDVDRYSKEKEAIYREIFADRIAPTPGLVDLLEGLKRRGVKMAVGSSGMRANVDFVLDKCGIKGYFDAIADGDMITRAKPDPEVFMLAASLLGLPNSECLVFEDSFAGIAAARAAGSPVIALATTFPRERHTDYDMLIDDFTEIDSSVTDRFASQRAEIQATK